MHNLYGTIRDFFVTPSRISSRVVRGGMYIYTSRLLVKAISFVRTIVIARLLFPEDLGLFGLASLAMTATSTLFQPGFGQALIHEKKQDKQALDGIWTFNVLRGFFIGALLFFIGAPLAGHFFGDPNIVALAKALSLVVIIEGFESLGAVFLQKELRFNRKLIYDVVGTTVQVATVIVAAFVLRNAWALLVAVVVGRTTYVMLSYVLHEYRPRFVFDFSGAKQLFRYGKWIGLTGIISFLIAQGDFAVIGRILDPTQLGLYQLAFGLAMLPTVEVVRSLGGLLFPTYARIQDDTERLYKAFIRVIRLVFALSIPASIGIIALAPEIVLYIYGERWIAMTPILIILAIAGLVKAFELMVIPLILGVGRPKIQTFILTVEAVLIFACIIPLTHWYGTIGTAWGIVGAMALSQLILTRVTKQELNIGITRIAKTVFVPVISAGVMFTVLMTMKQILPIINVAYLLAYVLLGVVIYSIVLWRLDMEFGRHFHTSYQWIKAHRK